MQFEKSETMLNLARAFAGECQAGMRYQLIAKKATSESYARLSDLIKSIAKNETVHAATFYSHIRENAGSCDNITFCAGYPFKSGTLEENLRHAAEDEEAENAKIYPEFARIAEDEGFKAIAASFKKIAAIEGDHRRIFSYLSEAIKSGTLYTGKEKQIWLCSECGYVHFGESAPAACPVCKKEQGYFNLNIPSPRE